MKPVLAYSTGALLFRQLAAATRNRLPHQETLEILSQDPEMFGRDAMVVQALISHLGESGTLSGALKKLPELVAPETAQLIETAERQGDPAAILDAVANDYTELAQRRAAIRTALFWPGIVSGALVLLVTFMMIFVVPSFSALFSSFGANLPAPTLIIMAIAEFISVWWWVIAGAMIGLFLIRHKIALPPGLATATQRVLLRLPFLRNYLVRSFSARTINWLHITHRNRDVMLAAIRHVRATTSISAFKSCMLALENRLGGSTVLGQALLGLAPLPKRLPALVQLGEKMGDIDGALAQAGDFAEAEREIALALLERGLVLAMYCVIGAAVALAVIAMYLPIFKMGEVVG